MIANITSGNSFKGLVMYNEKKVMSKKAIRIYGNIASIELTTSQLITLLEDVSDQNNKVSIKTFHVSLAFAQLDKIDDNMLKDIGNEYMEKMGYGNSPYMIYSHFDTGIDHMHILSTRINMEGRKVNDTYEKYKSQRITRELEIKYNLEVVPSYKDKTKKESLIFNIDGSINTKHLLEVAIDDVLNNIKATSMEHFVKNLAEKKVIVDFQREDKKGYVLPMPGILFSMGYKNTPATKRIKGSLFHKKYTYKNIINILNQNLLKEQSKVEQGRTKEELKKVIKILIPKIQVPDITSTSDLDLLLKVNKLKAIYLSNSGGIYGLKILDLTSNLEYKASEIDRDFSCNVVKTYLASSEVRKPKESREQNSFMVNNKFNDGDAKIVWVNKIYNVSIVKQPIVRTIKTLQERGFVSQVELDIALAKIGFKAHLTRNSSQPGNEIQSIAFTEISTGKTYAGNKLDFKNLSWDIMKDFVADDNKASTFDNYVQALSQDWNRITQMDENNIDLYFNYLNQNGVTIKMHEGLLVYQQINGEVTASILETSGTLLYNRLFDLYKQTKEKGINQLALSPIHRRFVNAIYKNDQSALKELIKYGDRINLNDVELSNASKEGVKTYKQLVNTQSKVSKAFKFAAYCASLKQSEINYESKSKKIGFDEYILVLNKRGIGVSFDVDEYNLVKNIVYHDKNKTGVILPADMAPFLSELTLSKFVDFNLLENFKSDIDNNNGFIKLYTDDQIDLVNSIENNNDYLKMKLIGKGTVVEFTAEEISYFEMEDNFFEEETIAESEMPREFKKIFIELIEGLMQTTQGENPKNRNDDQPNSKKKRRGLRI